MEDFNAMTLDLLKHKFRYYKLNQPIISDYSYDMLEKRWMKMGKDLGIDMDYYEHWVDFDENHPMAKEAEHQVVMEFADKVLKDHAELFRKLAESGD